MGLAERSDSRTHYSSSPQDEQTSNSATSTDSEKPSLILTPMTPLPRSLL